MRVKRRWHVTGKLFVLIGATVIASAGTAARPVLRLQLAESYLTSTLFRQILGRIERLAWHPT